MLPTIAFLDQSTCHNSAAGPTSSAGHQSRMSTAIFAIRGVTVYQGACIRGPPFANYSAMQAGKSEIRISDFLRPISVSFVRRTLRHRRLGRILLPFKPASIAGRCATASPVATRCCNMHVHALPARVSVLLCQNSGNAAAARTQELYALPVTGIIQRGPRFSQVVPFLLCAFAERVWNSKDRLAKFAALRRACSPKRVPSASAA